MTKTTTEQAKQAANGARDAYSHDRYTIAGWMQIALRLAAEGANPAEIDWVLRSKHMRWAADMANRSYSVTAADFANYVVTRHDHGTFPWQTLLKEVREDLNKQTPKGKTGADLAGDCSGEDIADLINLARKVKALGVNTTAYGREAAEILERIERRAK